MTTSLHNRIAYLTRVFREEATIAQPALWLANCLGSLVPTGNGLRIRAGLYRMMGVSIGPATVFYGAVTFTCHRGGRARITIGARCFLNAPLYLDATEPITIGNGVAIGHHVVIITTGHEIGPPESRAGVHHNAPVTIGDGTWIAANVTLLPGVTIGKGVVIAAGAVVTKDVPDNVLVGGVPARILRELPS